MNTYPLNPRGRRYNTSCRAFWRKDPDELRNKRDNRKSQATNVYQFAHGKGQEGGKSY